MAEPLPAAHGRPSAQQPPPLPIYTPEIFSISAGVYFPAGGRGAEMLFPKGCCGRGTTGRSNGAEPERNERCFRLSPIKELIRKAKRRSGLKWIWGVGAFSDTVSLRDFPSAIPIGAELGLRRGDGSLMWVFKEERWGFPSPFLRFPSSARVPGQIRVGTPGTVA